MNQYYYPQPQTPKVSYGRRWAAIVAAVLLLVNLLFAFMSAAYHINDLGETGEVLGGFSFVFFMPVMIIFAVSMFTGKKNGFLTVASILLVVSSILMLTLKSVVNSVALLAVFYDDDLFTLSVLYGLLMVAICVLLMVAAIRSKRGRRQSGMMIPLLIAIGLAVILALVYSAMRDEAFLEYRFDDYYYYYDYYYYENYEASSVIYLLNELFQLIALLFATLWITSGKRENAPDGANAYAAPSPYGQPVQPQYAQPQYAQPQYAQPQYGQQQYGQPQYAQPQYGQPQYGQPQYGQPQYGQPQYAPQYDRSVQQAQAPVQQPVRQQAPAQPAPMSAEATEALHKNWEAFRNGEISKEEFEQRRDRLINS